MRRSVTETGYRRGRRADDVIVGDPRRPSHRAETARVVWRADAAGRARLGRGFAGRSSRRRQLPDRDVDAEVPGRGRAPPRRRARRQCTWSDRGRTSCTRLDVTRATQSARRQRISPPRATTRSGSLRQGAERGHRGPRRRDSRSAQSSSAARTWWPSVANLIERLTKEFSAVVVAVDDSRSGSRTAIMVLDGPRAAGSRNTPAHDSRTRGGDGRDDWIGGSDFCHDPPLPPREHDWRWSSSATAIYAHDVPPRTSATGQGGGTSKGRDLQRVGGCAAVRLGAARRDRRALRRPAQRVAMGAQSCASRSRFLRDETLRIRREAPRQHGARSYRPATRGRRDDV